MTAHEPQAGRTEPDVIVEQTDRTLPLQLAFVAFALSAGGLAGYLLYTAESLVGAAIMAVTAILWPILARRRQDWFSHVAFVVLAGGAAVGLLLTGALFPALVALTCGLAAWHFSGLLPVVDGATAPEINAMVAGDLLWLAGVGAIAGLLAVGIQRITLTLPFLAGLGLGLVLLGATALLIRTAFRPPSQAQEVMGEE